MGLPIFTPRLVLRPFREADDVDALVAYRSDPEVARWQSWDGMSRDEAVELARTHSQAVLGAPGRWQQIAIAIEPGDRLIGDIGLFLREDGRSAELGFTLAGLEQRRGFAREAIGGLIAALFELPGLERLDAVTDARNGPAMALLARLGFTIQSTAEATFKGAACVEHTYSLRRGAQ